MVSRHWKRWFWATLAFLGVAIAVVAVRELHHRRAQREREAAYERSLRSYSAILKPGTSRKEVEDYLYERKIEFQQICCVDTIGPSTGVLDDLIKIGQEDHPWYCSEKNVYIALQFAGQKREEPAPEAVASDRLKAISIFQWLEGCL